MYIENASTLSVKELEKTCKYIYKYNKGDINRINMSNTSKAYKEAIH